MRSVERARSPATGWSPRRCCSCRTTSSTARQYLHARQTLTRLLELGCVPIINENDAIASRRDALRRQRPHRRPRGPQRRRRPAACCSPTLDGLYTADPRRRPRRRAGRTGRGRRSAAVDHAPTPAAAAGAAAAWRASSTAARIASWSGVRDGDRQRRTAPDVLRRRRSPATPVGTTFEAHAPARCRRASCGSPSPPGRRARSSSTTAPAGRWSSVDAACCPAGVRRRRSARSPRATPSTSRDPTASAVRPRAWCSVDAGRAAPRRRQAHPRPAADGIAHEVIHRDDLVAARLT